MVERAKRIKMYEPNRKQDLRSHRSQDSVSLGKRTVSYTSIGPKQMRRNKSEKVAENFFSDSNERLIQLCCKSFAVKEVSGAAPWCKNYLLQVVKIV